MSPEAPGCRPGPLNDITDVPGLSAGHAGDAAAGTGVTLLLCDAFTPAAVDVRGGGPATREVEVLAPGGLVGGLHALCFSGGSVFGLAAADGVVRSLAAQGVGLRLAPGAPSIPIVPAACLYDLRLEGESSASDRLPDYAALGAAALSAAQSAGHAPSHTPLGAVGAGLGARAGNLPGGAGAASLDLGEGLMVAALMVANPVGSVKMPDSDVYWAWPWEIGAEFGGRRPAPDAPPVASPLPADGKLAPKRPPVAFNTTIGAVATNADLSAPERQRLAIMAQTGLIRAIRPAHTPFDGDVIFALATAARPLCGPSEDRAIALTRLASAAADCVTRAIARAVYEAAQP